MAGAAADSDAARYDRVASPQAAWGRQVMLTLDYWRLNVDAIRPA